MRGLPTLVVRVLWVKAEVLVQPAQPNSRRQLPPQPRHTRQLIARAERLLSDRYLARRQADERRPRPARHFAAKLHVTRASLPTFSPHSEPPTYLDSLCTSCSILCKRLRCGN